MKKKNETTTFNPFSYNVEGLVIFTMPYKLNYIVVLALSVGSELDYVCGICVDCKK